MSWPIAFGNNGGLPVSQTHQNRRPILRGQGGELSPAMKSRTVAPLIESGRPRSAESMFG
jgi:hypothetical protein